MSASNDSARSVRMELLLVPGFVAVRRAGADSFEQARPGFGPDARASSRSSHGRQPTSSRSRFETSVFA